MSESPKAGPPEDKDKDEEEPKERKELTPEELESVSGGAQTQDPNLGTLMSSDRRLKQDIRPLHRTLERLRKL